MNCLFSHFFQPFYERCFSLTVSASCWRVGVQSNVWMSGPCAECDTGKLLWELKLWMMKPAARLNRLTSIWPHFSVKWRASHVKQLMVLPELCFYVSICVTFVDRYALKKEVWRKTDGKSSANALNITVEHKPQGYTRWFLSECEQTFVCETRPQSTFKFRFYI